MTADLAAIIEEGERLLAAQAESLKPDRFFGVQSAALRDIAEWSVSHGPTLLAVARAAVEMRRAQGAYFGVHSIEHDPGYTAGVLADATAVFDAAVRGEEKK